MRHVTTITTILACALMTFVGCGAVKAGDKWDAAVWDSATTQNDSSAPVGARLTGTVWGPHPDGEDPLFPVSGAAIIAATAPPEPIPDETYCEPCVEIPAGSLYAYSDADGTFSFEVMPGGSYHLIVQKGQFRRVRQYTAPAEVGEYELDAELTTLPHRTDAAAGDTIPKIALVYGDYDHIEDVLAKVGLGDDDGAYGLLWGSEAGVFDVYDNSGPGEDGHGQNLGNLINDLSRMMQYHIIIFACSYNANFNFMESASVKQNIQDYVWAGGKLYVSDYAMPVVEIPDDWREFAWFINPISGGGCNENDFPPSCNHGPPFDAPGEALDQDLAAWLDAMGELIDLELLENWDTIGALGDGFVGFSETGTGPNGETYQPPKVWVQGPWNYDTQDLIDFGHDPATWDMSPHPFTISWPYNCGRVLFTTYHTVGGTQGGRHPGLYSQEKILFYLLMEVTVCQEQPVVL